MKSIELCVSRFDEDTKASFLDLYTKIDAGTLDVKDMTEEQLDEADVDNVEIAF